MMSGSKHQKKSLFIFLFLICLIFIPEKTLAGSAGGYEDFIIYASFKSQWIKILFLFAPDGGYEEFIIYAGLISLLIKTILLFVTTGLVLLFIFIHVSNSDKKWIQPCRFVVSLIFVLYMTVLGSSFSKAQGCSYGGGIRYFFSLGTDFIHTTPLIIVLISVIIFLFLLTVTTMMMTSKKKRISVNAIACTFLIIGILTLYEPAAVGRLSKLFINYDHIKNYADLCENDRDLYELYGFEIKADRILNSDIPSKTDRYQQVIGARSKNQYLKYINTKNPYLVQPLISLLGSGDYGVRQVAVEALGDMKDPAAVGPLIKALEDRRPEVNREAVYSLRNLMSCSGVNKDTITASIVDRLGDDDSGPSEAAVNVLRQKEFRDSAAVDIIIKKLEGKSPTFQNNAITVLGWLKDTKAVEPLIKLLYESDAPGVPQNAIWALGEIGDHRAGKALIDALQDNSRHVRRKAVLALGKMKYAPAVEPLIAVLNDKYPVIRRDAARLLGKFDDPRAIEPLVRALKDSDRYVRKEAAIALADNQDPRVIKAVNEYYARDGVRLKYY